MKTPRQQFQMNTQVKTRNTNTRHPSARAALALRYNGGRACCPDHAGPAEGEAWDPIEVTVSSQFPAGAALLNARAAVYADQVGTLETAKKLKVASSECAPGSKELGVATTETKKTVAFRPTLLQRQSAIDYIAEGHVPGD